MKYTRNSKVAKTVEAETVTVVEDTSVKATAATKPAPALDAQAVETTEDAYDHYLLAGTKFERGKTVGVQGDVYKANIEEGITEVVAEDVLFYGSPMRMLAKQGAFGVDFDDYVYIGFDLPKGSEPFVENVDSTKSRVPCWSTSALVHTDIVKPTVYDKYQMDVCEAAESLFGAGLSEEIFLDPQNTEDMWEALRINEEKQLEKAMQTKQQSSDRSLDNYVFVGKQNGRGIEGAFYKLIDEKLELDQVEKEVYGGPMRDLVHLGNTEVTQEGTVCISFSLPAGTSCYVTHNQKPDISVPCWNAAASEKANIGETNIKDPIAIALHNGLVGENEFLDETATKNFISGVGEPSKAKLAAQTTTSGINGAKAPNEKLAEGQVARVVIVDNNAVMTRDKRGNQSLKCSGDAITLVERENGNYALAMNQAIYNLGISTTLLEVAKEDSNMLVDNGDNTYSCAIAFEIGEGNKTTLRQWAEFDQGVSSWSPFSAKDAIEIMNSYRDTNELGIIGGSYAKGQQPWEDEDPKIIEAFKKNREQSYSRTSEEKTGSNKMASAIYQVDFIGVANQAQYQNQNIRDLRDIKLYIVPSGTEPMLNRDKETAKRINSGHYPDGPLLCINHDEPRTWPGRKGRDSTIADHLNFTYADVNKQWVSMDRSGYFQKECPYACVEVGNVGDGGPSKRYVFLGSADFTKGLDGNWEFASAIGSPSEDLFSRERGKSLEDIKQRIGECYSQFVVPQIVYSNHLQKNGIESKFDYDARVPKPQDSRDVVIVDSAVDVFLDMQKLLSDEAQNDTPDVIECTAKPLDLSMGM